MDSNDFLDHSLDITLRDLLDLATLTELAQKIGKVHGIGLVLFSPEKDVLLNTLKSTVDSKLILDARPKRGEQKMVLGKDKESVAVLPVIHEMDAVGFLALGPFSNDRAPEEIRDLNDYLMTVFEVIVFTSMKRHLTNMTHIASITESYKDLERANQELQVSFEKLKEIDQMKSNFLAVVSHELRTPLTSVIGYSEMLLEGIGGSLTDGQRGYVNVIMEKADQLLNLIKEILNLSKIEAGRIQVSRKPASPREVAQIAYETILPMAEKKGLKVDLDLSTNLPVSALLDAEKLLQVFNNLLSNAVKFTEQGGKIHFSMNVEKREGGEHLQCTVKDSGIGISEEYLEKIFEKFFQVDNTSTRAFGGTGLGLAIARSFVEIQGGKLWLESVVGKGTTFFVSIPLEKVLPGAFGVES